MTNLNGYTVQHAQKVTGLHDLQQQCLRILRCYHDQDGRMFEMSVSHHPGDRFAYSMHIDVEG